MWVRLAASIRLSRGLVLVLLAGCSPSEGGPLASAGTEANEGASSSETSRGLPPWRSTTTSDGASTQGSAGESPVEPAGFEPDPAWDRWEVRFPDYEVPVRETTYACYGMSFTPEQMLHVVAFEAIIDDPAVVHHMILSRTSEPMDLVEPCYPSPEGAIEAQWGWAPGVEPLVVPPQAGFLVGDEPGPVHYVLQIHYDNPGLQTGHIDASGVNLYYTKELRPQHAGVALLGDVANLVIPPGQPDWETIHFCSGDSTRLLMQQPAHVFASWLHAHLIGKSLWTDHLRGGEKLGELGRHDPYRFENQRFEP